MNLASVHLDLAFDKFFKEGQMEAYQRLLLDVINGRLALFVRRDEQEAAWRYVEPILDECRRRRRSCAKAYASGTTGDDRRLRAPRCWRSTERAHWLERRIGTVHQDWY